MLQHTGLLRRPAGQRGLLPPPLLLVGTARAPAKRAAAAKNFILTGDWKSGRLEATGVVELGRKGWIVGAGW